MKKRIFLVGLIILMLVAGLFTLTGCGSNENGEQNTDTKTVETKEKSSKTSNEFKIKDVAFKFDQDVTFKDFNYKNDEKLTADESKQAVYLEYKNNNIYDGRFVFRISLLFTGKTTLNDYLNGSETENKKINGIEWTKLNINNTVDGKETISVVYLTEQNGKVYSASTMAFKEANVDIDGLSEVFMNGVTLNN